jgi:hypothetical protein
MKSAAHGTFRRKLNATSPERTQPISPSEAALLPDRRLFE